MHFRSHSVCWKSQEDYYFVRRDLTRQSASFDAPIVYTFLCRNIRCVVIYSRCSYVVFYGRITQINFYSLENFLLYRKKHLETVTDIGGQFRLSTELAIPVRLDCRSCRPVRRELVRFKLANTRRSRDRNPEEAQSEHES